MLYGINNDLVNTSIKLMKIRSTFDRIDKLLESINFVENYFNQENVFIKKFIKNDRPSIIISNRENELNYRFILCGHLDVVEGEDNQFQPYVENGKLYGRGSADMKVCCVSMMQVFKEVYSKINYPVALMFTTDEEVGGMNGVGYLINEKNYKTEFFIIPDGGINYNIVIEQKGILYIKLIAKGVSAHSSKIWEGDNAIDKLINSINKIHLVFNWSVNENEWGITKSVNKIIGGDSINKVPNYAEACIDIRYTNQYTNNIIINKIKSVIDKDIDIEIIIDDPVFSTNKDNIYLKKIMEIITKVTGENIRFIRECGGSDARFFSCNNMDGAIFTPPKGNIHSINEWIDLDGVYEYYEIIKRFLLYY